VAVVRTAAARGVADRRAAASRLFSLRRALLRGTAALVLAVWSSTLSAVDERPDETTLHAAYLVNFLRYASFPASDRQPELVVAVIGPAETAAAIRAVVSRAPPIDGRRLVVRHVTVNAVAPARDEAVPALQRRLGAAHLVYVAPGHASWQPALVEVAAGEPMLTVGTAPGFAADGGMFELFAANGRVYFAVNADVLAVAPVRISARVIALARRRPREND
jgi:hypothetical protein